MIALRSLLRLFSAAVAALALFGTAPAQSPNSSVAASSRQTSGQEAPVAAPAPHPLNGIPAYATRMEYDPLKTGWPIVYLSINGSEPLPFVLDTGFADALFLERETARRLHLPENDTVSLLRDSAGIATSLGSVEVKKVEMPLINGSGKVVFDIHDAVTGHLEINDETISQRPVAGIIGIRMFVNTTLYLEFERQRLLIIPGNHPPLNTIKQVITMPLKRLPDKGLYAVEWSPLAEKPAIRQILDTGAGFSSMPPEIVSALEPASTVNYGMGSAFSAKAVRKLNRIRSLSFGTCMVRDVALYTQESGDSCLGIDILSHFRVGVDFRRGLVTLEPTRSVLEPDKQPGIAAVQVARKEGKIVVARLLWEEDRYTRCKGKEVVSIDGEPIAGMTVALAQSLLNGYCGPDATLVVRDGTREVEFSIPRRSIFQVH